MLELEKQAKREITNINETISQLQVENSELREANEKLKLDLRIATRRLKEKKEENSVIKKIACIIKKEGH